MIKHRVYAGLVAAAWFATMAACQVTSGGVTPDPAGGSDIGGSANFNQVQTFQHGSVYYMGHVKVAGEFVPWDRIPVVVTCNGVPRFNTYANDKGEFRIQPPPSVSEMGASNNNPHHIVAANLAGCKVRAVLQGFQSSQLNIISNTMMDNSDLGTITLTRDEKNPGAAVSATSQAVSKDGRKNFEKARAQVAAQHPDDAMHSLEKAVKSDPKFAEAWYQLGKLQEDAKKYPEAQDSYEKAVAADPNYDPPLVKLAGLAALQKNWKVVLDSTNRSLALDPEGSPHVWYYNALGYMNTGNAAEARKSAEKALAMDPSHLAPNTEQLLAVILASHGDYQGALTHLRNSLAYTPAGPNREMIQKQIAQLEQVTGSASTH